MGAKLAYYLPMRYWTLLFAVSFALLFAVSATAQVNGTAPCVTCYNFGNHQGPNGVPPSVTSYGFGGKPGFHGTTPSVTSLGPNGWNQGHPGFHQPGFHQPGTHHPGDHRPPDHRHDQVIAYPYFIPYYPAMGAYGYDEPPADDAQAEDPEEYQGGPTIFDRRGSGTYADDFVTERPKARVPRPPDPPQQASNDPAPDPPASPVPREPDTILVFKDGHKVQVGNYAIVGPNLFDLTPGHRQKVALADLDVNATQKANDDQGVDFKLPSLPGSE